MSDYKMNSITSLIHIHGNPMSESSSSSEESLKVIIERERTCKQICAELNNFVNFHESMAVIIKWLKSISGCQAASIRLHDGEDYPYFVYDGFPEKFIHKENSLCVKDENGNKIPSSNGNGFLLECMCGNVICGKIDSTLPFFTENGSFWSNNTTKLLVTTTEEDRQCMTRNYCNSCGYKSVALIPIKYRGTSIGLIQFNDMREGLFDIQLIQYLEMIGDQVGIAIQNSWIHRKLQKAFDEIKTLKGIIPICLSCFNIRNDSGYWQKIDQYIRENCEADVNNSICPGCIERLYPETIVEDN